jgi:hypothetical protein
MSNNNGHNCQGRGAKHQLLRERNSSWRSADRFCPLAALTTITMQFTQMQYNTHNTLTSNLLFIWKDGSSDGNENQELFIARTRRLLLRDSIHLLARHIQTVITHHHPRYFTKISLNHNRTTILFLIETEETNDSQSLFSEDDRSKRNFHLRGSVMIWRLDRHFAPEWPVCL